MQRETLNGHSTPRCGEPNTTPIGEPSKEIAEILQRIQNRSPDERAAREMRLKGEREAEKARARANRERDCARLLRQANVLPEYHQARLAGLEPETARLVRAVLKDPQRRAAYDQLWNRGY